MPALRGGTSFRFARGSCWPLLACVGCCTVNTGLHVMHSAGLLFRPAWPPRFRNTGLRGPADSLPPQQGSSCRRSANLDAAPAPPAEGARKASTPSSQLAATVGTRRARAGRHSGRLSPCPREVDFTEDCWPTRPFLPHGPPAPAIALLLGRSHCASTPYRIEQGRHGGFYPPSKASPSPGELFQPTPTRVGGAGDKTSDLPAAR